MTWTATAQGTGAPTPTPSRTPGINLTCPDESFDTEGLEYDWAMVCSACVRNVRGTPPPLSFPSLNFSTFTPQPTDFLSPTPSNTPTPTATVPSPTPTPPGGCLWTYAINFALGNYVPHVAAINTQTGSWDGSKWLYGAGGCGAPPFAHICNRQAGINITFPTTANLISVTMMYDLTYGHYNSPSEIALGFTPTCAGLVSYITAALSLPGVNQSRTWTGFSLNGVCGMCLQVFSSAGGTSTILDGFAAIKSVTMMGIGANLFTGAVGCPTGTPPPSATPTPTNTPLPGDPTATPEWWATAFPIHGGLSVDCSVPRYIDLDQPLVDWHFGPSEHEPVCLTILPQVYIGFDLINGTAGEVFGFDIDPVDFQRVDVCFVGISVVVNFLGFQLDMSILLGVPILAYLLRWVLFQ